MSDCLFCGIVGKSVPSKIVFEDDHCLAFEDINPQAPAHILVIPKKHLTSLAEVQEADAPLLGHLINVCSRVAKDSGIERAGYRVVANTGANAGQSVFHVHFHVLGGRPFRWPPG